MNWRFQKRVINNLVTKGQRTLSLFCRIHRVDKNIWYNRHLCSKYFKSDMHRKVYKSGFQEMMPQINQSFQQRDISKRVLKDQNW